MLITILPEIIQRALQFPAKSEKAISFDIAFSQDSLV